MTTPEEATTLPQPWHVKYRRWLYVAAGVVGAIILIVYLIGTTPPPGWGVMDSKIGHPLALLVDPVSPNVLYAGTEQGKVFTSSDSQNWHDLSTGLPANAPVSALARSPDGTHMLAGTSQGVFSFNSTKTAWSASTSGLPQGDGIDALAYIASDGKTVLAGTEQHGIYRSADGGATWSASGNGLPNNADVYGVAQTPDGKTLFAALIGAGIYRSTDGGATWAASNTGLPGKLDAFSVLAVTDNKNASLVHVVAGTSQGVFASTDNGDHWTASSKGIGTTRTISLTAALHQTNLLLAGTDNGVYESGDTGASWRTVAKGIPSGEHVGAVAISEPAKNTGLLFAAGAQLYRYPGTGTPVTAWIVRILVLGLLVGALVWTTMRQRRTLQVLMPQTPSSASSNGSAASGSPGTAARASGATTRPSATPRLGTTGHIRGGPPPKAPDDAAPKD